MRIISIILIIGLLAIVGCATPEATTPDPVQKEPVAQATCDDGIKNQGEEDIDCGGPCKLCPGCTDGIKNMGEEGIDCGGPCGPCASCDDGILNQGEEKVDCGGPCEPCPVEKYKIAPADLTAFEDKLKLSTKAEFLRPAYPAGLEVGESHVFVLGITNIYLEEEDFMISLDFKNAKDLSNNYIEKIDKDTVLGWLDKNEFETYTLEKYEQIFLPVGMTVGEEIAPGIKTKPGNYYFKLVIDYQKSSLSVDKYIELDFTFRVK